MKDVEIKRNLEDLLRAFIGVAQADGYGRYKSFDSLFNNTDTAGRSH